MAKMTNTQRIEVLEQKMDKILDILTNGQVPQTTAKGSKGKAVSTDLELTKEQLAIVKKWKPTHRLGKDKGSINQCLRGCAYEFCGGKNNYKESLYTLGKKAWFTTYNKDFREALPETK